MNDLAGRELAQRAQEAANDPETHEWSRERGDINLKKAQRLLELIDQKDKGNAVDEAIREHAARYRGDNRPRGAGCAGEVLARLSAITGADFDELVKPENDPAQIIRNVLQKNKA